MKSKRQAYRPGNLEEIRFDNRVRSEFGFHFKSYDPTSGTLTVLAREEELKCDRSQMAIEAEIALGEKALEIFPGLRRIETVLYPVPEIRAWDFRLYPYHTSEETER